MSFFKASLHDRRHRWKVLGIGVAANASFSAAFQGIPTTAVFMRSDYHLTNGQLGLVLGLLGLGIAISELPWGLLTDRWGDRKVLLAGLVTTAVSLALMALAASPTPSYVPGLWNLALGLLAVGLLGGSVNGASGRAVMTWFHEGERGFAMSIRQTAVPLGGGLGALMLPTLAAHLGFVTVYGILALSCAVTAFFTWTWLHEPPVEAHARQSVAAPSAATEARNGPMRDLEIWRTVAAIGILCAPQFAILTFASVFLHDFGRAGLATITGTLLVVQIGAMVTRVWSGRWTDRKGNRRAYLRACSQLSVLAFAALAIVVACRDNLRSGSQIELLVIVALLIIAGICVSAWHGVAYTELATLAGASRAGTALGMGNTCVFVSLFLTPLAIPFLAGSWTWAAVWAGASLCALVALPLFPPPAAPRPVSVRAT
jgi:MFS family permease